MITVYVYCIEQRAAGASRRIYSSALLVVITSRSRRRNARSLILGRAT